MAVLSVVNADLPLGVPLLNPDGSINQQWIYWFLALQARTGGPAPPSPVDVTEEIAGVAVQASMAGDDTAPAGGNLQAFDLIQNSETPIPIGNLQAFSMTLGDEASFRAGAAIETTIGVAGGPISNGAAINFAPSPRLQSATIGSPYTVVATDAGVWLNIPSGGVGGQLVRYPAAGSVGFAAGWVSFLNNSSSYLGAVQFTAASGRIGPWAVSGAYLYPGQSAMIVSQDSIEGSASYEVLFGSPLLTYSPGGGPMTLFLPTLALLGGWPSGNSGVDIQTSRSSQAHFASGTQAWALGADSTVSGAYTMVFGQFNKGTGTYSQVFGYGGWDDGNAGVRTWGAYAMDQIFSPFVVQGTDQIKEGLFMAKGAGNGTIAATLTLTTDGNGAGATNVMNLGTTSKDTTNVVPVCVVTARDTTNFGSQSWALASPVVLNQGTVPAGATIEPAASFTSIGTFGSFDAAWGPPSYTADTTHGGHQITFPTGSTTATIVVTAYVLAMQTRI